MRSIDRITYDQIGVLIVVHIHVAGQREAERSQIHAEVLGLNLLDRLLDQAVTIAVVDVDYTFAILAVVRRTDRQ